MKKQGYKMTLISTRADENAQHLYRKLGYIDCGGLVFHDTPFDQPMEMFLGKFCDFHGKEIIGIYYG